LAIAAPLLALAILFGVFPQTVFRYMTESVNSEVQDLTAWKMRNPDPVAMNKPAAAKVAAGPGVENR